MALLSTIAATAAALGVWRPALRPFGCTIGRVAYRETRRAAQLANINRRPRPLSPATQAILARLFPGVDVGAIRVRTGCRLPPNRFNERGPIIAMTFGDHIYWAGSLDETNPRDLVNVIHEVVHVEQFHRYGGESGFACEYGAGYVAGGGELPPSIRRPTPYHRNPLEAEAYRFEARFQDSAGRVRPELLPDP